MRFDVSNFTALRNACTVFDGSEKKESMILILHTPGGIPYRFIINEFGIEKQQCTKTGEGME